MEKRKIPLQSTSAATILESIPDGVFTVNLELRITFFNRAAEQITGLNRKEAIGRRCAEVFHFSMCSGDCALQQSLQSGKPVINKPGFIVGATGRRILVSLSTAVLRDQEGRIVGGIETFRDLSGLKGLGKVQQVQVQIGDLVCQSKAMQEILDLIPALASSSSTVLIQGETGTGKELLARAIHEQSYRAAQPFIAVNCGALPDNLLESELFGYKRGAFTGANKDKLGRFAVAGQGTLFLDEIGEISPALQIRLLRVLQERTFEPLGATVPVKSKARIIAATNKDLAALVAQGRFRQDLFYRINVISIELPPLREHKEDIPLLIDHFIDHFNKLQNKRVVGCSPEALSILMAHDWPGNVRELKNVVERAFVLCFEKWITIAQLPTELLGQTTWKAKKDLVAIKALAERQSILAVLQRNKFNRAATAKELGIHKTTLYRKIKALHIELPGYDGRYKN